MCQSVPCGAGKSETCQSDRLDCQNRLIGRSTPPLIWSVSSVVIDLLYIRAELLDYEASGCCWSWIFHQSHSLAKCKQLPKINSHWHLESYVMSQKGKQENILFWCVRLFVVFWPGRKRNKFVNSGSPSKLFTLQSPFICCSCQRIHSSPTNL